VTPAPAPSKDVAAFATAIAFVALAVTACHRDAPSGTEPPPTVASAGVGSMSVSPGAPAREAPPRGEWDAASVGHRDPRYTRWASATPSAKALTCTLGPDLLARPPTETYVVNGFGSHCEETACAAAHGTCAWGGFSCGDVCALLTTDVGRPCSDSADCQSACVTGEDVPSGRRVTGTCSPTMVGLGCHNVVEKGIAEGNMCAD